MWIRFFVKGYSAGRGKSTDLNRGLGGYRVWVFDFDFVLFYFCSLSFLKFILEVYNV